ncbi:MAG: hypothetical protein QM783_11980 [Phycisphaerales bacterium]
MLLRLLAVSLLVMVTLLRVGGPSACVCVTAGGTADAGNVCSSLEQGDRAHAHEHSDSLGCDGSAGACEDCHRCRSTDAATPTLTRDGEIQPHAQSLPSAFALQAILTATSPVASLETARPAFALPPPDRPPPGVAVVRVTVLIV